MAAAPVKVVLNREGVRALLRSPEVQADLARRAAAIAEAAGPGHETDSDVGKTRARAWVWTATRAARRAEATSRTLTSAIDAGKH